MKHEESLKEISREMKTQNNRLSRYPYFVVYDRRSIPVHSEYSPITCNAGDNKRIIFTHPELEDSEFDSVEELVAYAQESGLLEDGDLDELTEGIEEIYVQDIDILKSIFLTEVAAKAYIQQQAHHLNNPYIYGESFYDNDEMRLICESIASLTPEIPPHKNGIGY